MIEGGFYQRMKRFLVVHTSMWTMSWDAEGARRAIRAATESKVDFIEIALLNPTSVDAQQGKTLLSEAQLPAVCSLGLPEEARASRDPEAAINFLRIAIEKDSAARCSRFNRCDLRRNR